MIRLLLAALLLAASARAETLRIGVQGDPTSLDPQFFNSTANDSLARNLYDRLVDMDERGAIIPALAESWRLVDATTWEFKLRPGVTFSNGAPLTAEDIVFSMARGCCIPNSPFSLGTYIRGKSFARVDDLTLRVTTAAPAPTMLEDMSRISIVSARSGERSTADYNAGNGSPGTGAYVLKERRPGDRIVLAARAGWWGGKPAWDEVVIRPIPSDAPRLAGLLTGELDVIDAVPPADAARLREGAATRTDQAAANRMVFLALDTVREQTPDIPGPENPLRKLEVRRALAQSISRQALAERVMDGLAIPTGQFATPGTPSFFDDIVPLPFDPAAGRARLAAAGYPDGFRLTLRGPNDRLVNDKRIAEAVAQMFTRIGVRTEVDTMPSSMFFPRTTRNEFSAYINSWGLYDLVTTIRANLHTVDAAGGFGVANGTRYSNPEIDRLTEQAMSTVDDAARTALLHRAAKLALDDLAIIPLYNQVNVWGTRRGLTYRARSDGTTVAEGVQKAP